MRRLFLALPALLFAAVTFAQQDTTLDGIVPVDESGKIAWQGVTQVPGQTKGKLYNKGIEWVNSYFPNPSSVTKVRSPEDGLIEGTHSIRLTDDHNGKKVPSKVVNYSFKLEFREGRFRYTITDFNLRAASKFPLERWLEKDGPFYDLNNKPYLEQIRSTVDDMVDKMNAYITKPDKPEEDDW